MSSITNLADATHNELHDTFRITGTSILDTVWTWVSRTSLSSNGQSSQQQYKKPKWATTTHGATTTLWTVSVGGALKEYARISWSRPGDKRVMVTYNGREVDADQILLKSRGIFGSSNSRTFTAEDGSSFKWKSGAYAGGAAGPAHTEYGRFWHCVTTAGAPSLPPRIAATIAPPQAGFLRCEFNLYCSLPASSSPTSTPSRPPSRSPSPQPPSPAVEAMHTFVLLTAILMCTHRDDHKSVQSSLTPADLEAQLVASALGALPPYLPSDTNNDRRIAADAQPSGSAFDAGNRGATRSRSAQASPAATPRRPRSTRRPSTAGGTPSDPPAYTRLEPPSSLRRRPKEESDGYTAPRPSRRPATSSAIR